MLKWLEIIARTIWSTLRSHQALAIENLALRQQLAVVKHRHPRPRLADADRLFWVVMSQIWVDWRESLHIVQPETVVRWHRQGFRYYWRWKSRRRGRPRIDPQIRHLIRRMCRANPLWGAPRIHGELLKLGIDVSEAAVSKYMIRRRGPPSQTWRTFLSNHAKDIIALDFFTVPTATFRILFVLIILSHDRRRILHVNVTEHPTTAWTALQLLEACGLDEEPRSPWQNPYAERVIGSIRRECLDHMIILGERHLKRILSSYVDYYHSARTHLSLEKDSPDGRVVQPIEKGRVVELKRVGGLHHLYARMAA